MIKHNYMIFFYLGLKPGGKYQVQVLGVTQHVLTDIEFSWYPVQLPVIDPTLPVPILTFSVNQSILVCVIIKYFSTSNYLVMGQVLIVKSRTDHIKFL